MSYRFNAGGNPRRSRVLEREDPPQHESYYAAPYRLVRQSSRHHRHNGGEGNEPTTGHAAYSPWVQYTRQPMIVPEDRQRPPPATSSRWMRPRRHVEPMAVPQTYIVEETIPAATAETQLPPRRYSQSPPPPPATAYEVDYGGGRGRGRSRSRSRSPRVRAERAQWTDGSGSARSVSPPRTRVFETVEVPRARNFKAAEPVTVSYDVEDIRLDRGYRPPSPIGGDLDAYDDFNFLFPKVEASKDGELSDADSPGMDSDSVQREDRDSQKQSSAQGVFNARYTGSAELGGSHTATLVELHDPKRKKRPLYKWLHVQQENKNFEEFWAEVNKQVHLSDDDRSAISKIRANVKKSCIKTRQNPKGARVGYMEPKYFEVPLSSSSKDKGAAATMARWICLPYFSLKQYSGLLSASNVGLFPDQTLLQGQYSRATEQRDMQQAVCQLGTANRGECFHISQLWCLVLDNTLLVTCGSMSHLDLRGDSLKLETKPTPEAANNAAGRILVVYGNAVTWSFPTVACTTWFQFLSLFHSFWPTNIQFTYNGQAISAEMWPKILRLASRPRGSVMIKMDTIARPALTRPELDPDAKHIPERLHVLMLQPTESRTTAVKSDSDTILSALKKQLTEAEKFLTGQTSYADQRAYGTCGDASRKDTYLYMTQQTTDVEQRASDSLRLLYEERVELLGAADDLFALFFPPCFDGPTTSKFWASLKWLLKIPELDPSSGDWPSQSTVTEVRAVLRDIAQDVRQFQNLMSYSDEQDRATIGLPRAFVTAWLHIVSGLICTRSLGNSWLAHITKARGLVTEGMHHIVQGVSARNILNDSAVLPLEIASMLSLRLLQDQVGKADDIIETYSQYLSLLDTEITSQPSDRSYQHRIDLTQQEMVIIRRTLAKQRSILTGIATSVFGRIEQEESGIARRRGRDATPWREDGQPVYAAPLPDGYARRAVNDYMWAGEEERTQLDEASKLSPVDPMGFRGLFLAECTRLVDQRMFELRRSVEYGADLERAVAYSIDWTKDRQENAIYAFTIVTIIFLPLSAISSIFGMNSSDVRDMEAGQWLYWAVALPSTLLIILIGLWWMGELGNVLGWMTGRRTNRASPAGYVSGVAPQMAGATTYIVEEPSGKADVQYDEGSSLPQPARYALEQTAPMVQRVRRRRPTMY